MTTNEIEQYIGIFIHMGLVQMSDYRMYWIQDTLYSTIASTMSRKRFDEIKSNFHIAFNSDLERSGKKFQIITSLTRDIPPKGPLFFCLFLMIILLIQEAPQTNSSKYGNFTTMSWETATTCHMKSTTPSTNRWYLTRVRPVQCANTTKPSQLSGDSKCLVDVAQRLASFTISIYTRVN